MNLQKIKLSIFFLILIFGLTIGTVSQAGILDQIKAGFTDTGIDAGYAPGSDGKPSVEFTAAFGFYASGMTGLMGMFFMILAMYAGYLWATARGNDEQVSKAQKILIQATIGLGVIITARIIAEVILDILATTLPA